MKDSRPQEWWNAFVHTGRIEDYLRSRGVDIYTARTGSSPAGKGQEEADPSAADNSSPDHTGEQQYR